MKNRRPTLVLSASLIVRRRFRVAVSQKQSAGRLGKLSPSLRLPAEAIVLPSGAKVKDAKIASSVSISPRSFPVLGSQKRIESPDCVTETSVLPSGAHATSFLQPG